MVFPQIANNVIYLQAQDLGLHRSSEAWDIPDSEKETRKRVWWSGTTHSCFYLITTHTYNI